MDDLEGEVFLRRENCADAAAQLAVLVDRNERARFGGQHLRREVVGNSDRFSFGNVTLKRLPSQPYIRIGKLVLSYKFAFFFLIILFQKMSPLIRPGRIKRTDSIPDPGHILVGERSRLHGKTVQRAGHDHK